MDLMSLFIRPPGDVIYYVMVFVLLLAAAWMAAGQRTERHADVKRLTTVCAGMVLVWLGFFLFAIGANADATLASVQPLIEQIVIAALALLLAWGMVSIKQAPLSQRIDRWFIGWLALLMIAAGGSLIFWLEEAETTVYSGHILNVTWAGLVVVIALIAVVLLLRNVNHVVDTPLKLVSVVILAMGSVSVLMTTVADDVVIDAVGVLRLSLLAAVLTHVVIVYRKVMMGWQTSLAQAKKPVEPTSNETETPPPMPAPQEDRPAVSPIERESVQLMRALGLMMENATPKRVPTQILNAIIEVLKVDIAVLLRVKDPNYADVEVAYDRFMERTISGVALNLSNQPTLANAIERRAQRMLVPNENEDELTDLYTRLDVEQMGPVYLQPMYREDNLIAILMLAMPYSKRDLLRSESELLKGISVIASGLLEMSFTALDAQMLAEERAIQAMVNKVSPTQIADQDVLNTRQALQESLKVARQQIAALSKEVVSLKSTIDEERVQLSQDLGDSQEMLSVSQQMANLYDAQDQLRTERDALAQRLHEAETTLQSITQASPDAIYEDTVSLLEEEKNALIAQRDSMEAELNALRNRSGGLVDPRDMQTMLRRVESERARLENERDNYQSRLVKIQRELKRVGFDAEESSISDLLTTLNAQRATLQEENESLKQQLQNLAMGDQASADNERMMLLQTTLKNVAGDREVAIKQRDKLARELTDLKDKLRILKRRWQRLETQAQQSQAQFRDAQDALQELQDERSRLINARDRLEAEKQALEMAHDQLLARIEGDRDRIVELGDTGVGSLTTMIEDLTEQRENLQIAVNDYQKRLAQAEDEIARLQEELQQEPQMQNPDLLVSMVQELRSPMTSMAGYLDLLLSESSGILGDMQRKFLLRVYTSMQRFDLMLDDLIRVTELDAGKFKPMPRPVNVTELIEDAITHAARQFREKGLTVNLVFEDGLPSLQVDHDALNEVIGQLLTNAYLVSPPDSDVTIRVEKREQAQINGYQADSLFISVEDRGGGISPEDEARVFARKYKAENPLIQGLGDTGVGLSIAKTLVHAQGGHLWLETENGIGSRFNFLLPLHMEDVEDAS